MDHPLEDARRRRYLTIWKEVLGAFLGWSEARVISWAETVWGAWIGDLEDLFFEQPPVYWALPAIIPDSLKTRLTSDEMDELLGKLLIALCRRHQATDQPGRHRDLLDA